MEYLAEINPHTDEFFELYDELPLWSAPFGLMILDRAPLRPNQTTLDVGSGTGFLSIELAERCGEGSRVIAVDPWKTAMLQLRRKMKHRGLNNITLLEQDASVLSLPDDSVDLVVSNLGVNNFDDPPTILTQCYRVAKPGSTFLLSTNVVGHMAEFYQVYHSVLSELRKTDRLSALEDHVNHRGTANSVSLLLEDAGFRVIDVATSSFRIRFADGSALLRHYFIRLGFLGGWKSFLEEDEIEETFTVLERRLNELAQREGELALTIPIACLTAKKPE